MEVFRTDCIARKEHLRWRFRLLVLGYPPIPMMSDEYEFFLVSDLQMPYHRGDYDTSHG
jgi:hypothetical protein